MKRLATWWLEHTLPVEVREAFIGDLEELYRIGSRWRFWWEVLNAPLFLRTTHHALRTSSRTGDGLMTTLLFDLRYAARQLARQPLFTAVAAFTLALGIGATTAIFSAVYPILMAPLPYPGADQLVRIWELDQHGNTNNIGYATAADLAEQSRSLASSAEMSSWQTILTGRAEPEMIEGQKVSKDFFRTLGVRPALGRDFTPEEDLRGAGRVAILSHGLWRARFAGDSGIVGSTITLDGVPVTIVGVMPAGFENVLEPKARIWTTLRYNTSLPYACRDCRHLRMVARLKPGVSAAAAQAEIAGIATRLKAAYPGTYGHGQGFKVPPLKDDITAGVRPALLAVLAAVALVLLIACANVTNLMLARASQRQGEFALRTALGAGGGRILRQLLTESLLLAGIGGALGIGVALGGVRALTALSPAELPRLSAISVNGPVLLFALLATGIVGIVFGIAPALHTRRHDLHRTIQDSAQRVAGGRHAARRVIVVGEIALALMLLVGSGLLLRSMARLLAVPPGFEPDGVVTMQIQTGGPRFATNEATWAYWDRVLEAVRAVPGVSSAGLTSQLPLSGDFDSYGVHTEHAVALDPSASGDAFRYGVSTGFHETMRIPLIKGRLFTADDKLGAPPVVILNEHFARQEFPGMEPVGQRLHLGDTLGPWFTVVGVVGDVRQVTLAGGVTNAAYIPETQWKFSDGAMSLVVRARGDAASLVPSLRRAIWAIDKDQPIVRIATMDRLVAATAAQRRFTLVLFEAFGLVALLLAAAGIYSVMSNTVVERLHEVGIRSALGASAQEILGMILRQGLGMAVLGVVIGMSGAVAAARLISGLLFDVPAVDPLTYGGVAVLLLAIAAAACALPAWRAARVDPARVLRGE